MRAEPSAPPHETAAVRPRIVIDGLFFQFHRTGIARVWKSYFEQWAATPFASNLVILDRGRTAPRIPGLSYRDVPAFQADESSREMLQLEAWCQDLKADLFISTFYSTPIQTRSVVMIHDMIYEMQSDGMKKDWAEEEKSFAILHASHLVTVSHNTARDVRAFYPHLAEKDFSVVHCGVDPVFRPAAQGRVEAVKKNFGLTKPYFLLVGTRIGIRGYKNAMFPFRTLDRMTECANFQIACVGGEPALGELTAFGRVSAHLLPHVSEEDLIALYSGAEALVYPSRYEGFGLPLIEAMACGCPVITCPNGSIPEVAGDAALFVEDDDDAAMARAMLLVGDPSVRQELRAKGFTRAALFSWKTAADALARLLLQAATLPEKPAGETQIWKEMRERDRRLAPLVQLGRSVPRRRLKIKIGGYSLHLGLARAPRQS
jgi:glycosyltransferase involved in cell wall biosynthesis